MNILQIQDKLKDLSDQQLVSEMTNPSGAAPQFLVLSEMKRRKEMRARASTPQAPQGSMAEEAVQDGIAALAQQPSSYDLEDQAEAEGMASGGIVRLAAGGETRRPITSLSPEEFAAFQRMQYQSQGRAQWPNHPGFRSVPSAAPYTLEELEAEAFRRSNTNRPNAPSRFVEDPESAFANRTPQEMNVRPTTPAGPVVPEAGFDAASFTAPLDYGDAFGNEPAPSQASEPATPRGQTSPQPQPAPPTARTTGAAQASGVAATGAAPAAAAGGIGSLPQARGFAEILDEVERRGSGSRLDELAAQMQRTDPAARRSEATNIALLEAGLRIAGSNNPNAIGALSEGAAALPGFARQMSEIRRDQRDDILTQIQMERARAEDARSARALAANLYGTETQRELAMAQLRQRAGENSELAAYRRESLVPQDIRTFRSMVGADYDDSNPRHREVMSQIQTRGAADRVPESVRLAEWINSAPNEDERRRRLEATGRDPALRQAQLDETRRRNIEDATRRFRDANPGFVPNLPEDNIGRMRPDAQQRYRALQSEFTRIQRGELSGGGTYNYVQGQGAVPAGGR